MYVCIYLSTNLSIYLSNLSIYISIYIPIDRSIHRYIYLFIYLCIYLSILVLWNIWPEFITFPPKLPYVLFTYIWIKPTFCEKHHSCPDFRFCSTAMCNVTTMPLSRTQQCKNAFHVCHGQNVVWSHVPGLMTIPQCGQFAQVLMMAHIILLAIPSSEPTKHILIYKHSTGFSCRLVSLLGVSVSQLSCPKTHRCFLNYCS